ncbi:unnamed protein product [Fusarium graminearum]|uniref:Uncharacterized protein n=1 Tax=Gibberella zeae (strain ATCC MYA-4620 / CBS 123657 / FGSC 9075 / NRRL 31084 / PH-1) TaxID=229533 RepID=I1R9U6_GIBZE|nr:hypothetical protein FGSG_00258 [Fusarium graminearum PH-1]ESU05414.1 hypothetical protein FGSG_00258 [Fusarium graminearum PH-1]CZS75411.1 unnamed protein product [Fusarium graminearum]|eukprot:XP_011315899.1 hypothetical protein FGSG_00258 [Fusarium graminearum PH-1]
MSETGTRRTPLATNWTKNFNMENVSNRLNINSEKDSQDLLLRNIRALPEREPLPPSTMASSSTQLPLMSQCWLGSSPFDIPSSVEPRPGSFDLFPAAAAANSPPRPAGASRHQGLKKHHLEDV